MTSTPIKSQIVIMSSQEMAPSSDESETIDVGVERNSFGDMNVNEVPIEIVDDLNNESGVDVTITVVEEPPLCLFTPVSDENCIVAAMKCSLVINAKSHPVMYCGIGGKCQIHQLLLFLPKQMEHVFSIHFHYFCLGMKHTVL